MAKNGQTRLFEDDEPDAFASSEVQEPFDPGPALQALRATASARGLTWVDAWDDVILAATCHSCGERFDGDSSLRVRPAEREPHYAALTCGACGNQIRWLGSPTATPRRDSNDAERADWMEYFGGALYCAMCGIWEYDTTASFEMHHVPSILDGCEPNEGRTIPLCRDCHQMSRVLRNHQLHARRLNPHQPQPTPRPGTTRAGGHRRWRGGGPPPRVVTLTRGR